MPILPSSGALRRFMLPVLLLAVTPVAIAQLPVGSPTAAQQNDDPSELLARALRTLATEPNNLQALTAAGHNALVLGDANAAVGFFGRAQEMAPRDGRVKAGLGSALVQLEKPQDALRLFGEASRLGVPEAEFAADRGLAYDLTGDSRKAQRDYALVLAARPEDATVRRRLALSQGISGDKTTALATLDPLLRQRDIAGWRAKTFVLAMTGDAKGASDITHIMMPAQADMLQPFLVRLGSLSAVDKAKAVHFGEIPSGGHNYTPTQLANIGTPPTYAGSTTAPAPAPRSDLAPLAASSSSSPASGTGTIVASQSSDLANASAFAPVHTTTLPSSTEANPAQPPVLPPADMEMPSPAAAGHYDLPHVVADRRAGISSRPVAARDAEDDCTRVKVPAVRGSRHHRGHPATTKLVCKSGSRASESASSARDKSDEDCTTVRSTSKGSRHHRGHAVTRTVCKARADDSSSAKKASSRADEDCTTVKVASKGRHHHGKAATKTVCKARDEDSSASTKSAGKASSHGDEDCTTVKVASKGRHHKGKAATKTVCKAHDEDDSAPAKSAGKASSHGDEDCTTVKVASKGRHHKGKAATKTVCKSDDADAAPAKSSKSAAHADEDCTPVKATSKSRHGKHHAAAKTVCKASDDEDAKPVAKKGSKASSDDADDSKGKKKGKASDEDDAKAPAKGSRIYVQVAGGSNKADMDKAWAGVKKKAPELMKGKAPSTTPLRATHRLMVGPFKDEAEAQAFVNKMSGKGLSGFVVKTTKSQKVDKVGDE